MKVLIDMYIQWGKTTQKHIYMTLIFTGLEYEFD